MNSWEQAKLVQEKAQYQDQCTGAPQAQACGQAIGRAVRVPLREQLEKRTYGLAEQHERATRALDILNRHPEFEEFLQLQELINSGLCY